MPVLEYFIEGSALLVALDHVEMVVIFVHAQQLAEVLRVQLAQYLCLPLRHLIWIRLLFVFFTFFTAALSSRVCIDSARYTEE